MYFVTFLSLGPGDPELLTLRAVRVLRDADIVLLPATKSEDGRLSSRAQSIITEWVSTDKVEMFEVPMLHDRMAAKAVYDDVCEKVKTYHSEGKKVVVAVEGDLSIYASTHYVLERLKDCDIPVEQVPGVPSFIAAAAIAGLSLVSGKQHFVVLPGDADAEALHQLLTTNHVVVIMKLSQCEEQLKEYLNEYQDSACHYFENVGIADAFHTTDIKTIVGRRFPYFSLAVLYPTM